MKELTELGLKQYTPDEVTVSGDFNCPHCQVEAIGNLNLKKLVGWVESPYHLIPYAVLECQVCFEKYRHHIYHLTNDPMGGFIRTARRWVERQNANRTV